jgi:hypothetical protein
MNVVLFDAATSTVRKEDISATSLLQTDLEQQNTALERVATVGLPEPVLGPGGFPETASVR